MSETPEPTPEQTAAANELHAAGTEAIAAESRWARALTRLDNAVKAAKEAGIPHADVTPIVAGGRPLGGGIGEHLRKMRRRHYNLTRT